MKKTHARQHSVGRMELTQSGEDGKTQGREMELSQLWGGWSRHGEEDGVDTGCMGRME
jgi:hypothetical protein